MTVQAVSTGAGLSSSEASRRLREDGPNVLPSPRGPSWTTALVGQLSHFFALMLWFAAGLSFLADMPQLSVAIVVVVVLNGVFAFVQEFRADRAGMRLRDLLPVHVTVVRDGHRQIVEARTLVRGDVVALEAGDRVCADIRLDQVHSLAVDESMLTGESLPVRPVVGGSAWAGTFVVEGGALGLVQEIGSSTQLAGIAALAHSARPPLSPLAVQLHRVVRVVGIVAVVMGVAFFTLAVQLGMSVGDGFLFAIGVTVALVPEGLLPTVTLSLARASQRMASEHALVRRLEAVETLGSTTFICTDKTGTITRNQMSAVRVWTPRGSATVKGTGYEPSGHLSGSSGPVRDLAASALLCSTGRARERNGDWEAVGDPMETALHVLAMRAGLDT
jgi:magnesium-transporting ATPase (P-type)